MEGLLILLCVPRVAFLCFISRQNVGKKVDTMLGVKSLPQCQCLLKTA